MKWTRFLDSREVSRKSAFTTSAVGALAAVAGVLVALIAVVGLTRSAAQPTNHAAPVTPAAVAPGLNTSTLNKQVMKIAANGGWVNVYPADPLRPFNSTVWFAEVPVIVTAVDYDVNRKELFVSVEYDWSQSDEDALRFRLAEQSKHAGNPISEKSFTIAPLDVTAYSLLIRDMGSVYPLFSTEKSSKLATQTVAFRLPEMVAGVNQLHERLSRKPETVQLVLSAG